MSRCSLWDLKAAAQPNVPQTAPHASPQSSPEPFNVINQQPSDLIRYESAKGTSSSVQPYWVSTTSTPNMF